MTATLAPARVGIVRLGRLPYAEAQAWQQRAWSEVAGDGEERVALLEHEPVYTLGRNGQAPAGAPLPAPVVRSDRGGRISFHGPGQAVIYPVIRVRERGIRIGAWILLLEEAAIACASRFGVEAGRSPVGRGVWAGGRKLASVGVRVANGVSTHGVALNADTDLDWFEPIEPCGIPGLQMTSLSQETGRPCSAEEAGELMAEALLALLEGGAP